LKWFTVSSIRSKDGFSLSLIQSGSVRSIRKTTQLTEEDLGRYDVESLELVLASRKLTFEPIETMLIGAFGRIEVSGPTGKLRYFCSTPTARYRTKDTLGWLTEQFRSGGLLNQHPCSGNGAFARFVMRGFALFLRFPSVSE